MIRLKKTHSACFLMLVAAIWYINSALNPSNPPTAKTGAPGETTCSTSAGCHTDGTYTGSLSVLGLPDTVQPDQTYALTMVHTSNASKCGFQMTVLDTDNLKAGTLTAGPGSNVSNAASGRQYIRQSSAKNLSAGSASWNFNWRAPASANGDAMTFYLASLAANGNGAKTGDNALTFVKQVVLAGQPVSTGQEVLNDARWSIFPNPASRFVEIELPTEARVSAFDLSGRRVYEQSLGAGATRIDIAAWPAGMYVFRIAGGGTEICKKISKN